MSQKERGIIAVILLAIAIMVGVDLMTDSREGVMGWHMLIEALMGASALLGVFYIIRGSLELKHRLEKEIHDFSQFRKEADAWRIESRKYIEGLSFAIDQQLTKWKLSSAEKEVAFL
ncbi:MAG: helix-turn-helix transcriptional regulator, partial [Pseudobdellovibrionaceae bacterium]